MDASLLKRCPVCGYDLRGLPARHRCPECGFEYDEHTRVWGSEKRWVVYLAPAGLAMSAFGQFCLIQDRLVTGRTLPVHLVCYVALCAACAILVGLHALVYVARRRFVAVTRDGIVARVNRDIVVVPWGDVKKIGRVFNCPRIVRHSTSRVIELPYIFYFGEGIGEFKQAVEAARQRYNLAVTTASTRDETKDRAE